MSNILTTKLHVPPLRPGHVSRPRLLARLDRRPDGRITLVSAPAGYGKTTLIVEWLAQRKEPEGTVAWISLDEQDNDPVRFLAHVVAAVRQASQGAGEAALSLMQAPQPPPPEAVTGALVNDLASHAAPLLVVLDDYHVVHEMAVHRQMGFLVEHLPPQVHLVLVTREDPPLPLARLRARGQMIEIRQDDLRFSLDECAAFLNQVMGLQVAPADVAALERRTEGWIAGLQLAGLSMQGREDLSGFIEAFTGSSRYVLDYLIGEVLEQQPPDVQDFLVRTSILDRLTAPLCDAVMQRGDSQRILQLLDQRNLFVVPLDQSRAWYRYHRLFAELLAQRLRASAAQPEADLHRRACEWFAAQSLVPDAIRHALAAADWERAAGLVAGESVTMLRRGELVSLLTWLNALPPEVVKARPVLSRDYGWALTLTGQLEPAEAFLQSAESSAGADDALLGTILVAQAYHLRARGDNAGAIERGQRALSLLPESDPLSRSLVALTLGLAHWSRGSLREAASALHEGDRAGRQSRNHYARMTALSYLGVIQGIHGGLRQAAEMCRQAIEIGGQSPPVAPAHIELGALLYEWNDLEPAARHLHIGIELSQRTGNLMILCDGYRSLALLQQAKGDAAASQATLQLADRLADEREVTPLSRQRNAACHVQLALACGDLAGAQHWAEQVTGPADASPFFPLLALTPARLLLAGGAKAEAAEVLAGLHQAACQAGWTSGAIEVRALQALAAPTAAEALGFLGDALSAAEPEGFVRTFVDKGESMRLLLERLKSEGGGRRASILTLLGAFGRAGKAPGSQPLAEPMSERELEILRLLADGLSNQEIARRLVISVGTAKSHVHHILGKLNCDSRMQAVSKAREAGLL